ncbi:hypothetical protein Cgig2_002912 [Carnegiea gigantea]|uniref:Endonuclease/exonuclease/phosphatase domain-containing protein n=1 Tax=Carnegiea gigantea TaxID=171969 RepID=A0A9Q1GP52_9CARY|nr:hypothetical protein Cgig2_002912 [Carnegiea gigantea]
MLQEPFQHLRTITYCITIHFRFWKGLIWWIRHPRIPMDNIASWNIQGLNWSNKQEDVKIFLHDKKMGLVGLLETKIKEHNVQKVASKMFPNWKPSAYQTRLIRSSDQLIHCKVTQLSSNKTFYLSVIYGINHESQRQNLWNDLKDIAQNMDEAWCLMGDFNALRFKDDRIGGMRSKTMSFGNWHHS